MLLLDKMIIPIDGDEEVKCGNTTHFNAEEAEPSKWSADWQKNRNGTTELTDKESLNCKGSNNRKLGLNTVGKQDEENYQDHPGNQMERFAKRL